MAETDQKALRIKIALHGVGGDRSKARAVALASLDALRFDGDAEISIKEVETRLLEGRSRKDCWSCVIHCEVCW